MPSNGPVINSTSGGRHLAQNITKASTGLLTFSTNNSGWTSATQGTLTLSGGTTRLTVANPLGGAALCLGRRSAGTTKRRLPRTSPSIPPASRRLASLFIDHAIGGTASGQTATIGNLAPATTAISLNIVGDHGYNLTTGNVTVSVAGTPVINSYLNAAGYTAAGYTPGLVTLGNISGTAASALTLGGFGDFALGGTIANGTTSLGLNKANLGLLTIQGNNTGWTAASTLTLSAGITRINGLPGNTSGRVVQCRDWHGEHFLRRRHGRELQD